MPHLAINSTNNLVAGPQLDRLKECLTQIFMDGSANVFCLAVGYGAS